MPFSAVVAGIAIGMPWGLALERKAPAPGGLKPEYWFLLGLVELLIVWLAT